MLNYVYQLVTKFVSLPFVAALFVVPELIYCSFAENKGLLLEMKLMRATVWAVKTKTISKNAFEELTEIAESLSHYS